MSTSRYKPGLQPDTLVAEHEAATTDVHGLADTSDLVVSADLADYLPAVLASAALPADEAIDDGTLVLAYDSTDAAAKLLLKAKTDDGTVVEGEVALT